MSHPMPYPLLPLLTRAAPCRAFPCPPSRLSPKRIPCWMCSYSSHSLPFRCNHCSSVVWCCVMKYVCRRVCCFWDVCRINVCVVSFSHFDVCRFQFPCSSSLACWLHSSAYRWFRRVALFASILSEPVTHVAAPPVDPMLTLGPCRILFCPRVHAASCSVFGSMLHKMLID